MSVEVKNLSWEVNSKKILDDISLSISSGEIITILGPNGAGKSSFLKIISGDLQCTEGQVYFDQSNLDDISIQDRSFIRSVMSQSQDVVYDFSTREIIEMGWLDRGISSYSEDFKKAIDQISEECSVKNLLEQSFNTLSG